MICKIFIDKEHAEEVIIYAHEKTELTERIENLVKGEETAITGYIESEAYPISYEEIYCFVSEDEKIFAILKDKKYRIKTRLYKLEEKLSSDFIKINQSCIVNIKKIEKFSASIYGTLNIKLKNGYSDYVSRRNMKKIKERFGL